MQATQILEEGADPQMLYTCYGRTAAHRSTQSGSNMLYNIKTNRINMYLSLFVCIIFICGICKHSGSFAQRSTGLTCMVPTQSQRWSVFRPRDAGHIRSTYTSCFLVRLIFLKFIIGSYIEHIFHVAGVYPDLLHILDLAICPDCICGALLDWTDPGVRALEGTSRDARLLKFGELYFHWCKSEGHAWLRAKFREFSRHNSFELYRPV